MDMQTDWFKLDNIGLLYAPSANTKWSSLFRLSACLKKQVDPILLQQAADDILPRFPTFNVRMRSGFFWYFLEKTRVPFRIGVDDDYPCQFLNVKKSSHLFRILYYNNRIAFECFHAVTDGGGGWIFFKTLLRRYLELCGVEIEGFDGCLNYLDKPTKEERQDAFQDIADMKRFLKRKETKAFRVDYPASSRNQYFLTHGEMDTTKLKELAKSYGAGVGQFLAAVIAYSLVKYRAESYEKKPPKKRLPVVINTSIDLRRRFNKDTLRNFFSYINMPITSESVEFDDILKQMLSQYERITDDYIIATNNTNIRDQRSTFNKIMPLFIKNFAINTVYSLVGEKLATVSMSNYGASAVPKEFYEHIERLESSNGVAKSGRLMETSFISFGNKTVLTICSKGADTAVERIAFSFLASLGIEVKVDSNRRDIDE